MNFGLDLLDRLERFQLNVVKLKTKVITLTNHSSRNNTMNQSEFEADTCNRRQARENEQVTIGFNFTSEAEEVTTANAKFLLTLN